MDSKFLVEDEVVEKPTFIEENEGQHISLIAVCQKRGHM